MSKENEPVIVTGSNNSAGWFIAGIIVVALIVGGVLAYNGYFTSPDQVNVELKVPDAMTPDAAPADAQ